ncbi:hypothetical protein NP233_g11678 [Leucocoprinus birnbaumii]|uniref:Chromatin elongation factor SPT5 n=1 Tax=Leucocoprinus birnbaumii TaxID=56174 RepID=A0AAD5VG37_9AGAR|nr:hypothetical protein NP233_g11678 [Leucocoprinus birnbaumii]
MFSSREDGDFPLFELPCKTGDENALVTRIFCRAIDCFSAEVSPIRSVFAHDGAPGRVFVEAQSRGALELLTKTMTSVSARSIKSINIDEGLRCLEMPGLIFAPEPRGFGEDKVVERFEEGVSQGHRFRGKNYDSGGFLITEVRSYRKEAAFPSLDEIEIFRESPSVHKEAIETAIRQYELGILERGRVEDLQDDVVTVRVPGSTTNVRFSTSSIRRYFAIGDHVELVGGQKAGLQGWIMDINRQLYTATMQTSLPYDNRIEVSIHRLKIVTAATLPVHPSSPEKDIAKPLTAEEKHQQELRSFYNKLERSRVFVVDGEFKGREGTIISIDNQDLAQVELPGLLISSSKLVRIPTDFLLFKQSKSPGWFRLNKAQVTFLLETRVRYIPTPKSTDSPIRGRTPMPDGDPSIELSRPAEPEIPSDFWLKKLHVFHGKNLAKVKACVGSGNPTQIGTFLGFEASNVVLDIALTPSAGGSTEVQVPHQVIYPVAPSEVGQSVYILDDSDKAYYGLQYFVNRITDGRAFMGPMNNNRWKKKEKVSRSRITTYSETHYSRTRHPPKLWPLSTSPPFILPTAMSSAFSCIGEDCKFVGKNNNALRNHKAICTAYKDACSLVRAVVAKRTLDNAATPSIPAKIPRKNVAGCKVARVLPEASEAVENTDIPEPVGSTLLIVVSSTESFKAEAVAGPSRSPDHSIYPTRSGRQ